MGTSSSQPEQQPQHIFNADAPLSFSNSLLTSLQRDAQTDSTRAQDLELKMQTRVQAELARLRDFQAASLQAWTDELTVNNKNNNSSSNSTPLVAPEGGTQQQQQGAKDGTSEAERGGDGSSSANARAQIAELKRKLDGRRKVEAPPPQVERAREEVVRCLRTKDRRPLDCWREVEKFKEEVARLEEEFVRRTGR